MKSILCFLSLFYRAGSRYMRFLYEKNIKKQQSVPIPVISIGNITFGGSEKTPLSIKLIKILLEKGFKPAYISRGYKGKWEKRGGTVLPEHNQVPYWKTTGDEPYMTARNVPEAGIFLGKNRIASCLNADKKGYGVAVLDDGFQYYPLKKDLDIVLHDISKKPLLRESLSALNKAHIVLLKKNSPEDKKAKLKSRLQGISVHEYSVSPKGFVKIGTNQLLAADVFKQKKILAFCGIARPERFKKTLEEMGIRPAAFLKFPDHYDYPLTAMNKIMEKHSSLKTDILVTTEKDSVKLEGENRFKNIPVYYVKIDLDIEQGFFDRIFSSINLQKQ
ncbi:MAG TPA: tetraacyldisaccharide 4'-kinase [Candidatus Aminicenantes bacterium]|nr:tetraacyldisaccharide 4'-kinase [Candidatus Aminicenantes bacterium]